MKIQHKILSELIKQATKAGFTVMAETDGLYNYSGEESVWVEIRHVPRSWGGAGELCLSARRPGNKGWHSISINWFTGNAGLEKIK